MKTKAIALIAATLLTVPTSQAQQSPSPATQPTQSQAKPVPCTAVPLPKHVHQRVPPWLQKQINKAQEKIGTNVDVNGIIVDATTTKPCPPVTPPNQPKTN